MQAHSDQGQEPRVISVAELDRRLRRAVEGSSVGEWVEGEVSSLRVAGSGHLYFTLKDELEEACIDCVIYRSAALRARRIISDGAKIQIWGQATVWAPRGRLQFIGERVRAAGRGALLEALEQLKLKLQAEGLFSVERKRALPSKPRFVGVVTSLHGAAIHDIREVSSQRGRVVLVLSPAVVQGETAASSIVNALALIDRDPRVEVVIIGRGGGSSDDLMAFNDEQVVRRIASMRVPTVSAVGHEVDITLADLVADVRAATPSHAAELVVSDDSQAIARLREGKIRLVRAMSVRLQEDRSTSEHLRMQLADPRFLIAERQQLLDELRWRAERVITKARSSQRSRLEQLLHRLAARHPRAVITSGKSRFLPLQSRLLTRMRLQLAEQRAALGRLGAGLDALSPLTVLSRGYGIATLDDGRIVRAADQLRIGDEFNLKLLASALRARVVGAKVAGKG